MNRLSRRCEYRQLAEDRKRSSCASALDSFLINEGRRLKGAPEKSDERMSFFFVRPKSNNKQKENPLSTGNWEVANGTRVRYARLTHRSICISDGRSIKGVSIGTCASSLEAAFAQQKARFHENESEQRGGSQRRKRGGELCLQP